MKRVHFSEQVVHGLTIRTDNNTEFNPETGKISGLWQKFDQQVPVNYRGGERVFGVYDQYESDHTGQFNVLAGFDGSTFPDKINLTKKVIPTGEYLVFTKKGEMPQIAIEAWTEIWQYFCNEESAPEYQRNFLVDFEYYPGPNEIQVHIGIKR